MNGIMNKRLISHESGNASGQADGVDKGFRLLRTGEYRADGDEVWTGLMWEPTRLVGFRVLSTDFPTRRARKRAINRQTSKVDL